MSIPSIVIPDPAEAEPVAGVDPAYERIFHAFSRSTRGTKDRLLLPRAQELEREELAAAAIMPLLRERYRDCSPDVLIDCCSSAAIGGPAPTYKLAVRSGITRVLPFALDGQSGAEVAHALLFLRHMLHEMRTGAIISAVQRVVSPDSRLREDGFPLADAAAAVDCSPAALPEGFRVLGVTVGRSTGEWRRTLGTMLKEALRRIEVSEEEIEWSVAHRCCEPFLLAAQKTLSGARWMVRDLYPGFDFGSADTLVSLRRLHTTAALALTGIGVLWFVGRFGSIGCVSVEYNHGDQRGAESREHDR